jgi:cobyrinic acid a,c-diamide synthase
MKLPRIMIGAPASGSGKTLVTCGILQAFKNRGLKVASFKCGPDYIDPLFHSKVIGAVSKNLDTFFSDSDTIRYLFGKTARDADLSVMEGVMGYYDGVGGTSTLASSYELAKLTDTPVILVVNCKGLSLSAIPVIQGFLQYRTDSNIVGVILNQMPPSLYTPIKEQIETKLGIKALGYLPFVKELVIESRHLGLMLPDEIDELHKKLNELAKIFEETIDIDEIVSIAEKSADISYKVPKIPKVDGKLNIAVARDEAFCFYYRDNLELLQDMGASIIEFSPIYDKALPENIDGLLIGGGYPELVAEKLSANINMRDSIKKAINDGLPCLAECGGFMYLHMNMEDMSGRSYPMIGSIAGNVYKTSKLKRFGYVMLTSNHDQMIAGRGEAIAAHEFHYFDSDTCGESFTASKPLRDTNWSCIHGNEQMAVGFPHLYYYSNLQIPFRFLKKCLDRKEKTEVY